ncbi:MAG: DoxX family protein [Bacteroidota bacterium]
MKDLLASRLAPAAPYAVVLVRILFGIHLLYYSWQPVLEATAGEGADFLRTLGIPFPELMAWVYVLTEFLGGISVLVGYKTRWMSLPLIITFLVALFVVHGGDAYGDYFQALQMLLLSVFFLLRGAGPLSVDQGMKAV